MNEHLVVDMTRDGNRIPIEVIPPQLDAEGKPAIAAGIRLYNETSAWPRRVGIRLSGRNRITDMRLEEVKRLQGWRGLKLTFASGADDTLTIRGARNNTLPAGAYWVELAIEGMRAEKHRWPIDIKADEPTPHSIELKDPDPLHAKLTAGYDGLEENILAVLDGAHIDGIAIKDWLENRAPRERRKACLLNVLGKCCCIEDSDPIITSVRTVFFAGISRAYFACDPNLLGRLDALSDDALGDGRVFGKEGEPTSPTHKKMLWAIRDAFGKNPELFDLVGFRERRNPSLQVVIAKPNDGSADWFVELDIDRGNLLLDLKGFFTHIGEVLDPGKTNHFDVFEKLDDCEQGCAGYQPSTEGVSVSVSFPGGA